MNTSLGEHEIGEGVIDGMFRHNALFGGIPPNALDQLGIHIELCIYESGDIIFDEGDDGAHLYLVGKGSVLISKKGRGGNQETLAVKGVGEFFGEMSLLDDQLRSARVTATGPTLLGRVDRAGLECLLSYSPEAAIGFTRTIMQGIRSTNSLFIDELLHSERLSLVGAMMTSIVHDIRNPIASIMMASQLLESRDDDPGLASKGAVLRRAAERMQTMVQELLDFSRGRSQVDPETATMKELFQDLEEEMLGSLSGDAIEVRCEIQYDGPIRVDRNRIMRLLCNVVKNAVEAMPEGGTLSLRARKLGESATIEVEDTGCGIPPEVLARIFEPFVTHGKGQGTGLGMAIAKSVVEAHQGTITMESEVGVGSKCRIDLPLD